MVLTTLTDQANNAKYLAVLISGYLEQALKEILLEYASSVSNPILLNYVRKTWPISLNMKTESIKKLLASFNEQWANKFNIWLEQKDSRKADINSIVAWRNAVAHGQEANQTGITLVSVKEKFETVVELVAFVEEVTST